MNVGSGVRARRRFRLNTAVTLVSNSTTTVTTTKLQQDYIEITHRAVIATIDYPVDKNGKDQKLPNVCLLWEGIIPRPVTTETPFMITPNIDASKSSENITDADVEETEQCMESLLPLYPFEDNLNMKPSLTDDTLTNINKWKECGDTLYQIHDVVAAIPYYEYALYLTNGIDQQNHVPVVGATVFIKDPKGYIVAAEVDCVEDDDDDDGIVGSLDVTMLETGVERTIQPKDVLLIMLQTKEKDHSHHMNMFSDIQIRILLNLSRSLIQLGDIITVQNSNPKNSRIDSKPTDLNVQYRKSIVLATSLALAIIKLIQQRQRQTNIDTVIYDEGRTDDTLSKFETTGLLLRAKTQFQLNKIKHATADLQRIQRPHNKEAQLLQYQIQMYQKHLTKSNQALAKNVSRWIQTTLNTTTDSTGSSDYNDNTDANNNDVTMNSNMNHNMVGCSTFRTNLCTCQFKVQEIAKRLLHTWIPLLLLTIAVITAYMMQQQR